mmetsp:Transcript_901/g.564  ORF Transcript_901/g.564 Transcript_901/m.564 type:complete len:89 (+) Transcript_901:1379-1645(+)
MSGYPASSSAPNKEPIDKKKQRCRHWPGCKFSNEECEYFHPTEQCQFFPKCTYGDKCLYLHPETECKFGENCTRINCSYKHPPTHKRN